MEYIKWGVSLAISPTALKGATLGLERAQQSPLSVIPKASSLQNIHRSWLRRACQKQILISGTPAGEKAPYSFQFLGRLISRSH